MINKDVFKTGQNVSFFVNIHWLLTRYSLSYKPLRIPIRFIYDPTIKMTVLKKSLSLDTNSKLLKEKVTPKNPTFLSPSVARKDFY